MRLHRQGGSEHWAGKPTSAQIPCKHESGQRQKNEPYLLVSPTRLWYLGSIGSRDG